MSWRVVVITGRCKLEQKLGYLVCRGEETKKVFIPEISTLIIESTAVSITSALLCELIKQKINVVFCDEKHNPHSQLMSLYDRHDCSGILRKQIEWKKENKLAVWTEIVRFKITAQAKFLQELELDQAKLLYEYVTNLQNGDISNREGHAAKVYFDALFGLSFKRGDKTFINSALNYGYSVILSAFNREIVTAGYNTQLGIAHKNEFNPYNLACDFMEPFRVLIDREVFLNKGENLTPDYKHLLCNVLNKEIKIDGKINTVTNAISIYVRSLLNAIETGDISQITTYEL